MSTDKFTDNPEYVKKITNRDGSGLSKSVAPQHIDGTGNPIPYYEVSVKEKPGHASDTTITHTGPGAGVSTGIGKSTDMQGFVSTTGNRIMLDNTFGSDTIVLQHHSGATIMIDADGSIHMISSGKKGVGMVAPKGDGTVYAKNHLILKADGKLTIETDGDLDINVGGALSLHVKGDMHTYVEGSIEEFTDGAKVTEVVKDMSHTVGGDNRITVAGNMHTQVTGQKEIDVGKDTFIRSDKNTLIATQETMKIMSIGDMSHDTKAKFTTKSEDDMTHETKANYAVKIEGDATFDNKGTNTLKSDGNISINTQGMVLAKAADAVSIETQNNFDLKATGDTKLSVGGDFNIDTDGDLITKSGGATSIETQGTFDAKSEDDMKLSSGAIMSIQSTGVADFRSSSTDIDAGDPSPSSPNSPSPLEPNEADPANDTSDIKEAPKAQYPPAETIVDNMTTIREAPDFPKNAKRMSKGEFSLYKNEGNTPNPKAEEAASPNQGAGAPPVISGGDMAEPQAIGAYDKSSSVSNSFMAEKNPLPIPSSIYNTNEKISKHVTVGQILGLRSVPVGEQKAIITEAMHVAWNIIDPLIEKYGARVQITSWYRSNSGNHAKGGAVDLRCSNKNDVQTTSEIAAFVRDNLPYSKILLEKNDSPGIHVHVESAQAGNAGGGTVITCSDPKCESSVSGIQLQYAVAALEGRTYG
jgi:hypothetical protein